MNAMLKFAIAAALLATLVGLLLDADTVAVLRYEVLTFVFAPVVQLGWRTGLMEKLLLTKLDDTDIVFFRGILSPEYLREILAYEPDERDIFIVTFAKSGTHLLAQMTLQIVAEGKLEFTNLHEYFPMIEFEKLSPETPGCPDTLTSLMDARQQQKLEANVLGTHLPRSHVPYSDRARYIIMMRDPVDTLASGINMLAKMVPPGFTPSVDKYYDMFWSGEGYTWTNYYAAWWDIKDQPNVLFLHYEDALKDLRGIIIQITKFLGQDVKDDVVDLVTHLASYKYMKENSARFEPPACFRPFSLEPPNRTAGMVNKGVSGRGKVMVPRAHTKENIPRAF